MSIRNSPSEFPIVLYNKALILFKTRGNVLALDLKDVLSRRELVKTLVARNLKIRYKGSVLGFFWSLLDPLIMIATYYVFIKLMRFQVDLPYLVIGVITWNFFTMCLNDSLSAVAGSANLLKKIYFPRVILPIAMIIANFINFLLSMLVLLAFLVFMGAHIQWLQFGWLFVFLIFEAILCLGFTLVLSSLALFYKDLSHILTMILFAWFFVTPVFYPIDMVPVNLMPYYLLNPISDLIIGIRSVLLGTSIPPYITFYSGFAFAILLVVVGAFIFSRKEPFFSDVL